MDLQIQNSAPLDYGDIVPPEPKVEDHTIPVLFQEAAPLDFEIHDQTEKQERPFSAADVELRLVEKPTVPLRLDGATITDFSNELFPAMEVSTLSTVTGPPAPPIPGTLDADKLLEKGMGEIKPHSTTSVTADDLLFVDALPPFRAMSRQRPVSILLIGKPCAGKMTLANSLAKVLGITNIHPDASIAYARSMQNEQNQESLRRLDNGVALHARHMSTLLQGHMGSEQVKFGGYVLSRASVTPNELAEFKDNADLAGLWPPTFIVRLDIGNDDAIHRSNARTLQGGIELAWRVGAREEATAEDVEGEVEGGIELPSFDPLVPLESLEALQDGLSKYGAHNEALEKLVTGFGFDEGRRQMLQVDATQSREEVLEIVLHGVAQQRHTTKPRRLELENFKVAAEGMFQEVVSTIELETEGVVVQEVCGVFQRFDPVEFKTMRKLVEGSGDLTASYQGATYFFATPTNLEKFLACPTPYLGAPEMPMDYVIALVGAPKCGKSTVAEALEMQFGFTRLTMDLVGPDVLSAGGRLVLDGCPGSAEELEELKERGLVIDLVVYLTISDVELLVTRGRDVDAANLAEGEEEAANPEDEELLNRAKQFQDDVWPTLQGSLEVAELRQVEIDGLQSEAEVLRQVRCAMDPFLAYRLKHAGAVITAADIEASAEEGAMRVPLAPEVRGLRYLTTNFCPVSLRDEQLLVPGKDDLGLRVGHDSYSVFDDALQQRALKAPRRYHIQAFEDNDKELGPRMPQPRILLVGPRGAGKSTLAVSLKTQVRTQRVVSLAAGLPALMRKLVVDLIKADKVRVAEEVVQRGLERQERVAIKEAKDIERALSAAALEAEQAAADQAEEEEGEDTFPGGAEKPTAENEEDEEAFVEVNEEEAAALAVESRLPLEDFLSAPKDGSAAYETALNALLETDRVDDLALQSVMRHLFAGPDVANPPGFVAEMDVTHPRLVAALQETLTIDRRSMPHVVIPLEVAEGVAAKRLKTRFPVVTYESEELQKRAEDAFAAEQTRFSTMAESFVTGLRESTRLVIVDPIPAAGSAKTTLRHALAAIEPFLVAQRALFITPVVITKSDATRLLANGTKVLRAFGTLCPVSLHDGITLDCELLKESVSVLWAHYVVYCASVAHADTFMSDVVGYLTAVPTATSSIVGCVVVGPPLSGKTTLARKLERDLGLVYLSMPLILDRVAKQTETHLGESVATALYHGRQLPDEVLVASVKRVVDQADCRIRGWVLDDFPATEPQAELMEVMRVVPDEVFCLTLGDRKNLFNTVQLRKESARKASEALGETSNSARDLLGEIDAFTHEEVGMQQYWSRSYGNLRVLDGSTSRWQLASRANQRLAQCLVDKQEHHSRISKGLVARVSGLCISHAYLKEHRGAQGAYCPVALTLDETLMRHRLDVSYTAEYRQKYYQLSSERYLRKFLADPELYVGAVLPSELPFRVPYNEAQRLTDANAQLGGYCPVTLHRGLAKGKVDMIKGKASCAVWYDGRLFLLADGAAVAAFLARPARFAQQPAPAQLPPRIEPTSAHKLLEIGKTLAFMEQAVSRTLATAMATAGQRRLKYPGLSIGETTLLYFAALLKAGNKRYPVEEQLRFQQQLAAFEAACALTPSLALVYKPNAAIASRALVRSGAKATAQLEAAYDGLGKDLRERTQAGRLASHFDQYIF